MFELEDYSSGLHEGLLSKCAESLGPTLDFYISDSLQDMLDIDIRSEIANVVGSGVGSDLSTLASDVPISLDHAIDAISSINNNNSNTVNSNINMSTALAHQLNMNSAVHNNNIQNNNTASSTATNSSWMGPSWSSSSSKNDYYSDYGACVNPMSVMPMVSTSLIHTSPKRTNLNAAATAPSPASPNELSKSHLTFSPAQMKVSAGSIRHEQLFSHIPKQIVSISSTVTAGTTAPATMATNAGLQRKLNQLQSVDVVKKDLKNLISINDIKCENNNNNNNNIHHNNNNNNSINNNNNNNNSKQTTRLIINGTETVNNGIDSSTLTNTIKLAPGIGGLTFANSITYNKLKQQAAAKSSHGSPVTANGNIVLKRDRDSSPLHNMATLNGNKLMARHGYAPKSIASAAHTLRAASPAQSISMSPSSSHSSSSVSSCSMIASPSNSGNNFGNNFGNNQNANQSYQSVNVKPLQQKVKVLTTESEFPKPAYSYSCLIAMSLKNSRSGSLPVSEIYSFMCEHFPYFKSAPSGWKNSVRHNLSLNKCFEKIEKPVTNGNHRKGCLWAMNPDRIAKMDEEVMKWSRKDPNAIRHAMVCPENLEALERGEMKHGSSGDSDVELDSQSEIEEASDLEEHEADDVLLDNCLVEEDIDEDEEDVFAMDNSEADSQQNHIMVDEIIETLEPTLPTTQRDFDIDVEDIYDAIDMEDDKSLNIKINSNDIIEIGTADLDMSLSSIKQKQQEQQQQQQTVVVSVGDFQTAKRARLSYTQQQQTPLQRQQQINKQQLLQLQQQLKQQQQLMQQNATNTALPLKKVKMLQQMPTITTTANANNQQQQQTNQHIVVHSSATTPTVVTTLVNNINNGNSVATVLNSTQYAQLAALHQQQQQPRRKVQLINRIV